MTRQQILDAFDMLDAIAAARARADKRSRRRVPDWAK